MQHKTLGNEETKVSPGVWGAAQKNDFQREILLTQEDRFTTVLAYKSKCMVCLKGIDMSNLKSSISVVIPVYNFDGPDGFDHAD